MTTIQEIKREDVQPGDADAPTPGGDDATDIPVESAENDVVAAEDEPDHETIDATEEAVDAAAIRIEALESDLEMVRDKLLRAVAEMENVRKRAARDIEDARTFGSSDFARDILSVADNLSRALQAVEGEENVNESLVSGVELTMKGLHDTLGQHGILLIEALGEKFDPNFHQAMFEIESEEVPSGTVLQVLRSGYTIHGRLLRPSMVGISKKPPPRQPDE